MDPRADMRDGELLRELAAILAAGYERLLAMTSAEAKRRHEPPILSDRPPFYPLDTASPRSHESCVDKPATHSPEGGYA
jgi:hypothetical protein